MAGLGTLWLHAWKEAHDATLFAAINVGEMLDEEGFVLHILGALERSIKGPRHARRQLGTLELVREDGEQVLQVFHRPRTGRG